MRSHSCVRQGRSAHVELTKAGKGVKIMAIVDRCGLPLSIGTHPAQRCEAKLVQLSLDLMILDDHPENLVGGKVYDSDPLLVEGFERAILGLKKPNQRRHELTQTQLTGTTTAATTSR